MKIIQQLGDLSSAELGRVRATLRRRYAAKGRGGVLEVGFGMAARNTVVDPQRPEAICFYVRRKHKPRLRQERIPRVVEVRVGRGTHFVQVRLPSDVLEVAATSPVPTGRTIRSVGSARRATVGSVLAWRVPGVRRLEWGVLTVGHLFDRRRHTPESQPRVRIAVGRNREIDGILLARSDRASVYWIEVVPVLCVPICRTSRFIVTPSQYRTNRDSARFYPD